MITLEEHNNQIIMKRKYTAKNRAGVRCDACRIKQRNIEMIYIDVSIKKGEAPPKLRAVICPVCEDSGQKMMEE